MNLSANNLRRKSRPIATVGLFYCAAIWGTTFVLVKHTLAHVDVVVLVGYRFAIAGLALLIIQMCRGRSIVAGFRSASVLSISLLIGFVFQTAGLAYTTATNTAFITGASIFFTPLALRLFFRGRPTIPEWIASLISLTGLWILTGGLQDINVGDALTLISALGFAFYIIISDRTMTRGLDPVTLCSQQFLLIGAVCLACAKLAGLPFVVSTSEGVYAILFLAALPTLSGFLIQLSAQKFVTPVRVALILALEPVFAALFAWGLAGEPIIAHRALGGAIMALALAAAGFHGASGGADAERNTAARRQDAPGATASNTF